MTRRSLVARVLRAVADAISPSESHPQAAGRVPKRGIEIENAQPGTEIPPPYLHVEPGGELEKANQMCAAMFLHRALHRYHPEEVFYA